MAAARPVVATDVGGNREAVMDGETGLLVPPRDPGALAAAMLEVLQRPDRGASWGQAGRRWACVRFQRPRMVPQYEKPSTTSYSLAVRVTAMCGISGRVNYRSGAPVQRRDVDRDVRSAAASRAGRRWCLDRWRRGLWPSPSRRHRSVRRGPATVPHGGRPPDDHLQRRDLQLPGAAARSWSSAATASARGPTPRSILQALRGVRRRRACARLRGMFAFAIWDARRTASVRWRAIASARSRFYYARCRRPWRSRRSRRRSWPNPAFVPRASTAEALDDYLTFQYVPAPLTPSTASASCRRAMS